MRGIFILVALLAMMAPSPSEGRILPVPDDPRIQIIYARTADRPDRLGEKMGEIREAARGADAVFVGSALRHGEVRGIRYAISADGDIDVLPVVFPAGLSGTDQAMAYLKKQGHDRADRKYLVLWDHTFACVSGSGNDDRPGPENRNNLGPTYAFLSPFCWVARDMAHEIMHLIGGVQLSAPHSSGGFHCTDGHDPMCYRDRGGTVPMAYPCAYAERDTFDCGGDDYFHPHPPAGSYLDTHWNTANSRFLEPGPVYRLFLPMAH